jgi:hypothetical protein
VSESLIADVPPVPDFAVCNTCGADARKYVVWDQGDGWTCLNCFATDGGD